MPQSGTISTDGNDPSRGSPSAASGLVYGETRGLIPVPKSTLSRWCRDIRRYPNQIEAIKRRPYPGSHIGKPVNTQWRRRRAIEAIRTDTRVLAEQHMDDAFLIAGVALYWGEVSETRSDLSLAETTGEVVPGGMV